MTPDELKVALQANVDSRLATQLIDESVALEENFLLKRWKYTELDGGRFAEVAARITYSIDSQNVSVTKSVDDCLKYIDNQQVPHHFPEPQSAIHLAKVIRAIYKLRSQRGAVHVSPTYTANEIDSRFILEASRWVLAELLRLFVTGDREEVAEIVRELARFPQPLIRTYQDVPLLQSVRFTTQEEVLVHLFHAPDGRSLADLIAAIPKAPSGVRQAVKDLQGPKVRQVVVRSGRVLITDLGIRRIEERLASESAH